MIAAACYPRRRSAQSNRGALQWSNCGHHGPDGYIARKSPPGGGGGVIPAEDRLSSSRCHALPASTLPTVRPLGAVALAAVATPEKSPSVLWPFANACRRTKPKGFRHMPCVSRSVLKVPRKGWLPQPPAAHRHRRPATISKNATPAAATTLPEPPQDSGSNGRTSGSAGMSCRTISGTSASRSVSFPRRHTT